MAMGRRTFGGASAALGFIGVAWGAFAFAWEPIPPDLPGYHFLAYAAGALLVLGGVGVLFEKTARTSAVALGAVYALFAIPWAVRIVRFPQLFGVWGGFAEQTSMILASLVILSSSPVAGPPPSVSVWIKSYGVCAVVFGFNHFFSLSQTAGMVPPWLPPSAMFWAVATGVFHCIAGVAILTGIRDLLAARLLAAMMVVFEALVWLPSLIQSPVSHMVWAGNAVDIALAGAALVVADAIERRGRRNPNNKTKLESAVASAENVKT